MASNANGSPVGINFNSSQEFNFFLEKSKSEDYLESQTFRDEDKYKSLVVESRGLKMNEVDSTSK